MWIDCGSAVRAVTAITSVEHGVLFVSMSGATNHCYVFVENQKLAHEEFLRPLKEGLKARSRMVRARWSEARQKSGHEKEQDRVVLL